MVTFQTAEIYNEDQDNIIGVKVKVSADNGQVIDEIQVTNKTELDELKAKLDSLGDDYVKFDEESQLAGLTIEEILNNISQTININATKLNGIQSDGYAKASHTHLKSSITDLYTYSIGLSNYNVGVGDNVTVSVNVINQAGSPVQNHQVILYKNGDVWKTGTTNNSGVYSTTFSATEEGLVTFGVNNQKVQCNVKYDTGWVNAIITNSVLFKASGSPPCQVRRIGNIVHVRGAVTSITTMENFNADWNDYTNIFQLPDNRFYPQYTETYVVQSSKKQRCTVQVTTNGAVWVGRFTDASSSGVYNLPKNLGILVSLTYFVG